MSCFYDMREDETQTSWQRAFNHDVKDEELVWHRDREDRYILPTHSTDWKFQLDNELPQDLSDKKQFIPKGTYHRLIKGTGDLTLKIYKL